MARNTNIRERPSGVAHGVDFENQPLSALVTLPFAFFVELA
jgi:hypothetical protein